MPITIQPTTLKYKTSLGTFQSADCIKGDKGDQGDDYVLTAADKQEIATLVDDSCYIEEITSSTPTITGSPNMRYVCGTVSTLSITPPASGTIIVRFTSGSPAAILTLPNTVKMPEWWSGVEANYTYELCIEDGVYGSVVSWAV